MNEQGLKRTDAGYKPEVSGQVDQAAKKSLFSFIKKGIVRIFTGKSYSGQSAETFQARNARVADLKKK